MWLLTLGHLGIATDKLRCGAAAATDDVDQSLIDEFGNLRRHALGSLVVFTHTIGQSGVGVSRYIIRCFCGKALQIGLHLTGAKRAIEAYGENVVRTHAAQECVERLTRQRAACQIADRNTQHDRQLPVLRRHHLLGSVDGAFRVERIKDGLNKNSVHTAVDERFHLLGVGVEQFVVGQVARRRVAHVRTHGAGLVGGPHRACHIALPLGR